MPSSASSVFCIFLFVAFVSSLVLSVIGLDGHSPDSHQRTLGNLNPAQQQVQVLPSSQFGSVAISMNQEQYQDPKMASKRPRTTSLSSGSQQKQQGMVPVAPTGFRPRADSARTYPNSNYKGNNFDPQHKAKLAAAGIKQKTPSPRGPRAPKPSSLMDLHPPVPQQQLQEEDPMEMLSNLKPWFRYDVRGHLQTRGVVQNVDDWVEFFNPLSTFIALIGINLGIKAIKTHRSKIDLPPSVNAIGGALSDLEFESQFDQIATSESMEAGTSSTTPWGGFDVGTYGTPSVSSPPKPVADDPFVRPSDPGDRF